MADTDLTERLDRDIQVAERARSEMIEQGHAGWPNAVLFLMETATEIRTQLIALRAECEGLRQRYVDANEALIDTEKALVRIADARMPGLARRLAREALPVVRAALSQKETGNAA